MIFQNDQEVFEFIKKHQQPPTWITNARKDHKILKALVDGTDFNNVLIEKIEKIESEARKTARQRYSKDIRDLFSRVMQPRISVFTASGGSVNNKIASEAKKTELAKRLDNFKRLFIRHSTECLGHYFCARLRQ